MTLVLTLCNDRRLLYQVIPEHAEVEEVECSADLLRVWEKSERVEHA
jgi:hypothetical protein